MRRLILLSSIGSLLLFTGCGDSATNATKTTDTAAPAAASPAADSPESFIKTAAQRGKFQVEMGKLASTKASDPEIKKFGEMMVTEHTKANADVEKLASSKKVEIPKDMGTYQATVDKLNKMSGADFDKYYVEQMLYGHERDLKVLQKQAESGSDADVKALATQDVTATQKHLDAIKAIKAKMK